MTDEPPGPEDDAVETVLVVCRANVCRSPLAAGLLTERLTTAARERIRIVSAGLSAKAGQAMCAAGAGLLAAPGDAGGHRSVLLEGSSVRAAALVIVMEKVQRGTVGRMNPGRQHRVFTLVEAAAMADRLLADGEQPVSIDDLAEQMRGLRGVVDLPATRSRGLPLRRSAPVEALDVLDGHVGSSREHAATIRRVAELTRSLAEMLPRG